MEGGSPARGRRPKEEKSHLARSRARSLASGALAYNALKGAASLKRAASITLDPKPFFDWCRERHSVFEKRLAGQQFPWTDDPILTEYIFCNVFREQDKVTRWFR